MPRIENKFDISNKISSLREKKGLTQQQLADAVHVTRATVIALEKESYNPSLELAFRLARFFKVGVESVFSIKGE